MVLTVEVLAKDRCSARQACQQSALLSALSTGAVVMAMEADINAWNLIRQ
jgi:hypothetical protein